MSGHSLDSKNATANEMYLANKSLTFTESFCSIIATETSALTFLGIPAFAFTTDFSFLQIYIGAIFGRLLIASYFIPKFYGHDLTIYGTLSESHSTQGGQRSISLFYMGNKILSVGVRLFTGSILISEFFQINIYLAIFIITFLTFFYTLIGGLKAVVRTDILQMGIFLGGGIIAHFMIPYVSEHSWSDLISTAYNANKMTIFNLDSPMSFVTGILGGFLFDMATHGVDQDYMQRLIANKSMRGAQLSIFASSAMSITVGTLFLSVGALLWSHYQTIPVPDGVKPDHLFAYFISNYFPAGIKGLMVAGVMAATMSTLDSTINALCSCVYNDLFPNRNKSKINFYYVTDTIIITVLLLVVAFVSVNASGLLILGLKIASWTGGPLLALVVGKIFMRNYFTFSLNAISAPVCYALGIAGVAINTYVYEFAWQWNVYFGFAFTITGMFVLAKTLPKYFSAR
ncbi:MAG: hypothetical protein JNM93_12675 [Bacteriovoracaceae bacterium]|nr:hypothetical protein [Bacteriovoracaceae bacterium]